jgi:hypothetical protein
MLLISFKSRFEGILELNEKIPRSVEWDQADQMRF